MKPSKHNGCCKRRFHTSIQHASPMLQLSLADRRLFFFQSAQRQPACWLVVTWHLPSPHCHMQHITSGDTSSCSVNRDKELSHPPILLWHFCDFGAVYRCSRITTTSLSHSSRIRPIAKTQFCEIQPHTMNGIHRPTPIYRRRKGHFRVFC